MANHTIWTSEINIEDWRDDICEAYPDEELTDDEIYDLAWRENNDSLEDERANLNINVGDEILVLADLGLWDGRHNGFKMIHSENIADCLSGTCGDHVTWYVDALGDLWCDDTHHDGTNIYLYRAWKTDISYAQRDYFLQKVRCGIATRKDITRYTRKIGTYVADVYGWKVRR